MLLVIAQPAVFVTSHNQAELMKAETIIFLAKEVVRSIIMSKKLYLVATLIGGGFALEL